MESKKDAKISVMTVNHWRNKFDRSIRILLESGITSQELIEEIKKITDEKNNKTE
jgi:uncharacterized protein (UPF0218 family)